MEDLRESKYVQRLKHGIVFLVVDSRPVDVIGGLTRRR